MLDLLTARAIVDPIAELELAKKRIYELQRRVKTLERVVSAIQTHLVLSDQDIKRV